MTKSINEFEAIQHDLIGVTANCENVDIDNNWDERYVYCGKSDIGQFLQN